MAEDVTAEGVEARIKALAKARDDAKAEAAELRAAKAALESELAPLRERVAKADAEAKSWANERAFLGAGLTDPEAQDVARIFHERIPEAERPALDVWLATVKSDPAKAPKALAPYLGTAAPPAPAPAGANPTPPAPVRGPGPPPTPPRVETAPAAGNVVSADAIRAAAQQAARTGDWKAYEGLKAQVEAERTRR